MFTKDQLLANISFYWFTKAIGSSFWPYYARAHGSWPVPEGVIVDVPTAYAAFPREILHPPRSLAARTFANLQHWTVMERGGHFAAMEQPQALVDDIRAFFRTCRWDRGTCVGGDGGRPSCCPGSFPTCWARRLRRLA